MGSRTVGNIFPVWRRQRTRRRMLLVINNPEYDDSNLNITLAAGYYGTFEELSAGLHDLQMLRIAHVTSSHRVPIRFSFNKERNRVKMTVSQSLCITLSPTFGRILGFPHDRKIEYCLYDILAERESHRLLARHMSTAIWWNTYLSEIPKLRFFE